MDDIAEYRRRHREAYLKRVGKDISEVESCSGEPVEVEHCDEKSTSLCKTPLRENNPEIHSDDHKEDTEYSEGFKRDRYKLEKFDEDYEASLELAKKLQREFDSLEEVRKPDDSYKECLLSSVGPGRHDDASDMDLQRAIAKSLIDM